jgi:aspartate/methionine/tyrosine aminotransferase
VTEACALIGAADSEELRRRLLHEAGVAVLADIHFGPRVAGDGQHIRFSYATDEGSIEQGVARIAEFMRNNTRPPRQ